MYEIESHGECLQMLTKHSSHLNNVMCAYLRRFYRSAATAGEAGAQSVGYVALLSLNYQIMQDCLIFCRAD